MLTPVSAEKSNIKEAVIKARYIMLDRICDNFNNQEEQDSKKNKIESLEKHFFPRCLALIDGIFTKTGELR